MNQRVIIDNGDGTKALSCTDGSSVTISDGLSAIRCFMQGYTSQLFAK